MQAHQQLSKLFATLPVIYVLTFVAVTGGRAAAPPGSFQAVRGRLIPSERLDGSMNINWNDLNSAFFSTTDEDTKVLLAFKGEILTASAQDRPPTVSIAVTPERVEVGKIFKVTVEAEDDVDLQAMWWWAENSGIAEWDKAHFLECSGKNARWVWEVTAVKEGTFTFAANARDSAYPTPGEPHQASEGEGIAHATLSVVSETEVPPAEDKPPTVFISVAPEKVKVGETFKVLLKAEDDVGLQSMWWWGENTGIPDLDKAHTARIFGKSAASSWTVTATKEGTFSFAANARDSAYLIPGEAHQASEGEGIAYATITVTSKEIPIPSATIVDFGPDVPASIQYSSTMGQSIWVKGQKFAPNHTYIFKWKMFSANPVPCEGEVITNAEGSFDGTIILPAILPFGVQGKGQLHCYDKNSSIMITYRPFEIEKALL